MFLSGSELSRSLWQCSEKRNAGTFSPPCCLVFVGQDRQSWVPGPLRVWYWIEVLHLFRCSTHTPRKAGSKTEVPAARWRWGWQGNESEMRMKMRWKLLNRNTRRGTQKRRGGTKRKHQHQHTWPGAGEPWKAREKKKRRPTEEHQDQRRGGRTDAPEPT